MKRHSGGETVRRGVYLNVSTGEFVQLYGEVLVLPGDEKASYIKVPAISMLVVGPLAGFAYVMFLPLSGIVAGSGFLAYRVGQKARTLVRRAIEPAIPSWRPGIAYLIRRGPKTKEPPTGEDEAGLAELEQEVGRQRKQEKQ